MRLEWDLEHSQCVFYFGRYKDGALGPDRLCPLQPGFRFQQRKIAPNCPAGN